MRFIIIRSPFVVVLVIAIAREAIAMIAIARKAIAINVVVQAIVIGGGIIVYG